MGTKYTWWIQNLCPSRMVWEIMKVSFVFSLSIGEPSLIKVVLIAQLSSGQGCTATMLLVKSERGQDFWVINWKPVEKGITVFFGSCSSS